jgi:hypothetical protein
MQSNKNKEEEEMFVSGLCALFGAFCVGLGRRDHGNTKINNQILLMGVGILMLLSGIGVHLVLWRTGIHLTYMINLLK